MHVIQASARRVPAVITTTVDETATEKSGRCMLRRCVLQGTGVCIKHAVFRRRVVITVDLVNTLSQRFEILVGLQKLQRFWT